LIKYLVTTLVAILLQTWVSQADTLRLAVTTSFHNSGLSDILLPEIKADTGIEVQLLVVGTGQALKLGQAGDVDAILVHSRKAEEAFVAAGHGTHRREIMYNDFVFVGPENDPAGIRDQKTAIAALKRIQVAKSGFVSRGDDSGTHKKEQLLWRAGGWNPDSFGNWYRQVGAGMGAALNTAAGMNAYIIADRASWLNFKNKGELTLLYSGDPALFNQYAFLPVNQVRHRHANYELAEKLEGWLTGPRAAELINNYSVGGQNLFTFNAEN
jgi:tungstate transport system substrate-binding protein